MAIDAGDMHQLNVVTFDNPLKAQEFLLAMTRLATEGKIKLLDAVFVTKSPDGEKVRVHETTDVTPGRGALSGGAWGLLIGTLLLGPIGGLATGALSAGSGALMGRLIDAGVEQEFVEQIKEAVPQGRTALILLTDDADREAVVEELKRFPGATLMWSNLPPAARQELTDALAAGVEPGAVEVLTTPPQPDPDPPT